MLKSTLPVQSYRVWSIREIAQLQEVIFWRLDGQSLVRPPIRCQSCSVLTLPRTEHANRNWTGRRIDSDEAGRPSLKKEKEEKIQLLFLERFFASYQNKN